MCPCPLCRQHGDRKPHLEGDWRHATTPSPGAADPAGPPRRRPQCHTRLQRRRPVVRRGPDGFRGVLPLATLHDRARGDRLRRRGCAVGRFLGYRFNVCDARPVFATAAPFPGAKDVVVEWPHRYLAREAEAGRIDGRTVHAVLTHDPSSASCFSKSRCGCPTSPASARWGSRRTHEGRIERLKHKGLTDAEIARMPSPIGLHLGARIPQETAVSIAAEMIARKWGGTAQRLIEHHGRIHAAAPPVDRR
ncbi:XdhC family protein [Streptomyces sp. NPDC048496]|uniref:XdhC family protein n=1 Tax=Streptomyces sp. NPDC048496 TaxID=3365558 RepID=UPI003713B2C3